MASQLLEQLRTDLNTAMKDRDQLKTSTIRMVLSAVQVASVAGDEAAELTDAEVTAVLRSEANVEMRRPSFTRMPDEPNKRHQNETNLQ